MAGHSHWARIKRAKSVTDARRGRMWSKLARAVIVAARSGGGDPETNLNLRYAIDAARAANMPKDTIERAVKKGTGEIGGESFEELIFEGYGPGGAAILGTVLTDNRNRTAPQIRKLFERRAGNLGATNSVAWMFSKRGVFIVPSTQVDEDRLTEIALECGADDIKPVGDAFELDCEPSVFEGVRQALESAEIKPESAEISMVPSSTVTLAGADAERMVRLIEELEDHDDVQNVYSNFEMSEADLARLAQ
jgi:YebC/PmpR family DNA-binding regulatory protein